MDRIAHQPEPIDTSSRFLLGGFAPGFGVSVEARAWKT
jgi:hypothetical protein